MHFNFEIFSTGAQAKHFRKHFRGHQRKIFRVFSQEPDSLQIPEIKFRNISVSANIHRDTLIIVIYVNAIPTYGGGLYIYKSHRAKGESIFRY